MYISGSFKQNFLNMNRENTLFFNNQEIKMGAYLINYNGHVTTPLKQNLTIYKIEKQFMEGLYAQIILKTQDNLASSFNAEVTYLATKIKNLDYKLSLLALETLKKILANPDLKTWYAKIREFLSLIDYLNAHLKSFNQIDLEIIFNLFLNNLSYSPEAIKKEKKELFNIDSSVLSQEALKIYKMGEFMAPERLKNISLALQKGQNIPQIILYLLSDAQEADKVLNNDSALKLTKHKLNNMF